MSYKKRMKIRNILYLSWINSMLLNELAAQKKGIKSRKILKITDYHYNEMGQWPTQGEGSGVLYPLNTLTGEINLDP